MKDSGNKLAPKNKFLGGKNCEWIGEIPDNWKISRINFLYTPRSTKVSDKDYPPLSVTKKGVLPQLENVAKTDDHNNRKLVLKGDFAINSRSDRRGSCGISNYDGSVSLINIVLKPNNDMFNRYFNQLFHTELFADEFYKYGHGIVDDLWTTTWQDMKKISVPLPPLDQQKKIADFLDNKCSKVDKLLELLAKQVKVLGEYKKSLITETVTRGLNPNKLAPSTKEEKHWKDSGINWIGEIPKDWKIIRLKYICKITTGDEDTQNADNDGEYLFYVRSPIIEHSKRYTFEGESILMAGDGAGAGRIFHHAFGKYAVHQRVYILYNFSYNSSFLYYFLSNMFPQEMDKGSAQTTVPSVRLPMILNFKIPLPPLDEQQQIADFLDNKCSKIDRLLELKKKQIENIKEYKKSLIYEYVTGKMEVK